MLLVVDDVPIAARRLWWLRQSRGFVNSVFDDAHRGEVYVRALIWMNVHALWVSELYCIINKWWLWLVTTEKNNIFRGFVYTVRFSLSVSRKLWWGTWHTWSSSKIITKPTKQAQLFSLVLHVEVPPLHNVAIILFRMVVASTKLQSDTQAKCVSIKYRPGGETWNPPQ